MLRRDFLRQSGTASIALFGAASLSRARAGDPAQTGSAGHAPLDGSKKNPIRVAFMVGAGTNVIDLAGPWEVFGDTMPPTPGGEMSMPFANYTVGPGTDVLEMAGGLKLVPNFSVKNAPQPHVIVVPAQQSTPETLDWLRATAPKTDVTMSVCTGAFQLARAGLLKGLPATTHHEFWDSFAKEFPDVKLERGVRFVDNGRIATAAGLTSGIDMALHVVQRYFSTEIAAATAKYMEYSSDRWRA
jgi:transcriptional regulator GlxA family with amidase domain